MQPINPSLPAPVLPVELRQAVMDSVINTLNEAFTADPLAMHSLTCNRVPCNEALADHPTVQVLSPPSMQGVSSTAAVVGMLGVINGIVEPLTGNRVAMKWDEDKHGAAQLQGFCLYMTPTRLPS